MGVVLVLVVVVVVVLVAVAAVVLQQYSTVVFTTASFKCYLAVVHRFSSSPLRPFLPCGSNNFTNLCGSGINFKFLLQPQPEISHSMENLAFIAYSDER